MRWIHRRFLKDFYVKLQEEFPKLETNNQIDIRFKVLFVNYPTGLLSIHYLSRLKSLRITTLDEEELSDHDKKLSFKHKEIPNLISWYTKIRRSYETNRVQ